MRRFAAVAAAAATLIATACGHPFIPSSIAATGSEATAGQITTGVDLYVTHDYSLTETEALGKRDIAYIADVLRVQAIGIAWDLTVPDNTSDQVHADGPVTPATADISALTKIALSYHLQVEYRILFKVGGIDGVTESLHPGRLQLWFASLLNAETPYLKLAAANHVTEFVVGTELASIEGSPEWPWFFAVAGTFYHGILSYATWGDNFFSSHRRLPPIANYGVTAYPAVHLPETATVAQLTAAWVSFLDIAPASVRQQTAIDEIGIPAEAGAYADPWEWNNQHGVQDDEVQARWFTAACNAAVEAHMRAIFFWNVNLIDNPASPYSSLVKLEGRPASAAAIRNCGR
jgi:hypothetical protein